MPAFTILRQSQRLQHLRMQPVPESPLYSPPFCVMTWVCHLGIKKRSQKRLRYGKMLDIRAWNLYDYSICLHENENIFLLIKNYHKSSY